MWVTVLPVAAFGLLFATTSSTLGTAFVRPLTIRERLRELQAVANVKAVGVKTAGRTDVVLGDLMTLFRDHCREGHLMSGERLDEFFVSYAQAVGRALDLSACALGWSAWPYCGWVVSLFPH